MQVWPEGALGVELKFSGFSHKLSLLVSTVMEELSAFKVCFSLSAHSCGVFSGQRRHTIQRLQSFAGPKCHGSSFWHAYFGGSFELESS